MTNVQDSGDTIHDLQFTDQDLLDACQKQGIEAVNKVTERDLLQIREHLDQYSLRTTCYEMPNKNCRFL